MRKIRLLQEITFYKAEWSPVLKILKSYAPPCICEEKCFYIPAKTRWEFEDLTFYIEWRDGFPITPMLEKALIKDKNVKRFSTEVINIENYENLLDKVYKEKLDEE